MRRPLAVALRSLRLRGVIPSRGDGEGPHHCNQYFRKSTDVDVQYDEPIPTDRDRAYFENWAVFVRSLAALGMTVWLIGCATTSRHQFAEPTSAWHTRAGQLLYAAPNKTLIGDVVVRYSDAGDFELSLFKGPGVMLLSLRQEASFAEVSGSMTHGGWSGRIDRAPKQLRSWLELRDKLIQSQDRHVIRHVAGTEAFLFRF